MLLILVELNFAETKMMHRSPGCLYKISLTWISTFPTASQIILHRKYCKKIPDKYPIINSIIEEIKKRFHKLKYEIGQYIFEAEKQQNSTAQQKDEIRHLHIGSKELKEGFYEKHKGLIEKLEQTERIMQIYNEFNLSAVEETIGYKFVNKAYLIQSFTHGYSIRGFLPNYDRLEFLGDFIFDFLIKRFLFEHNNNYSPCDIKPMHPPLVSNAMFAKLAFKYNFHEHFLTHSAKPYQEKDIRDYVNFCKQNAFSNIPPNFIEENNIREENSEEEEVGEETIKTPKVMADVFEALAGAIYMDSGRDLEIVWRIFYNLMQEEIDKYLENLSPVIKLHQKIGCPVDFRRHELNGLKAITVILNDNLHFTGTGQSYRSAHRAAAKRALMHLKENDLKILKTEMEEKDTNELQKWRIMQIYNEFHLSAVEEIIGYKFVNKAHLIQIFSNDSLKGFLPNYKRVEYLGEFILHFLIKLFLFDHDKKYSPHDAALIHSQLVSNAMFAKLTVKYNYNFQKIIYLSTKTLAGAIYLDSGRDLELIWRIIYNLMREEIEKYCP